MYYFVGNPKALKTKPFDSTVVDPGSSIAHEWKYHLDLAIAAVDPIMKKLEQEKFDSFLDCRMACIAYSIYVNQEFAGYLSYTQAAETKKQQPQPPYI